MDDVAAAVVAAASCFWSMALEVASDGRWHDLLSEVGHGDRSLEGKGGWIGFGCDWTRWEVDVESRILFLIGHSKRIDHLGFWIVLEWVVLPVSREAEH
jgi:hypothetical protein